jgi:hypothetical protein
MSKKVKLIVGLGLALATWSFAMPASAVDEQFSLTGVVSLPGAQTLSSFDISFVDPASRTLAIAASRVVGSGGPFGTVIIVNPDENVVIAELQASPRSSAIALLGSPPPNPL